MKFITNNVFSDACLLNTMELYIFVIWCIYTFTRAGPLVLDDYWFYLSLIFKIRFFLLLLFILASLFDISYVYSNIACCMLNSIRCDYKVSVLDITYFTWSYSNQAMRDHTFHRLIEWYLLFFSVFLKLMAQLEKCDNNFLL